MDLLLRCNKLKALTQDAAIVAAALEGSENVQLNEDKTRVKKSGSVPALDEDVASRKRNSTQGASAEDLASAIAEKAEAAVTERLVYKLSGLPAGCRWTDIKDSLKETMATQGRMHVSHEDGQTEAHITGFKEGNAEPWATAAQKGVKVQETEIKMVIVDDPAEALAFWTAEFTKNPPVTDKKVKSGKKEAQTKKRKPSTTVNVCGTDYDYSALKTRVAEISKAHSEDFVELTGDEKDFMLAVLEHHPRAEAKKDKMTGLAVGPNKEFPETRCFFVCKEGSDPEDFSSKKCIDTAFGLDDQKKAKH